MLKTYYLLTKPGIIMGNLLTAVAGFALGSRGHFNYLLFLETLIGLGLVIASACVCNNYIDRETDQKMRRTKNRALVKKLISEKSALLFALILGLAGMTLLTLFTNPISLASASVGFFVYVVLYSFWKYQTRFATLVGSIAGAIPPVVGYCAASHRFDMGAFLLFLILVLWQMPHFFSIAMYRFDDYHAASIPVLPITRGIYETKVQMMLYIIAFTIASLALSFFGYMGMFYSIIACLSGLSWALLCFKGFTSTNNRLWARKMFILSLAIVTTLCITIPMNTI